MLVICVFSWIEIEDFCQDLEMGFKGLCGTWKLGKWVVGFICNNLNEFHCYVLEKKVWSICCKFDTLLDSQAMIRR